MEKKNLTFSMVKPDATKRNIVGKIVDKLESAGLSVVAQKMLVLSRGQAEAFYAEHKERSFYGELCDFIVSGPVIVQVLSGDAYAVMKNRQIMGATDPKKADKGTIRNEYGLSIEQNSIHGSDSPESASREISFFFSDIEICC